jgi:hypothetical protein
VEEERENALEVGEEAQEEDEEGPEEEGGRALARFDESRRAFKQKKWLFFVGIKALILNKGKILLLSSGIPELSSTKRSRIFWDLPGGKAEWGESVAETLRR